MDPEGDRGCGCLAAALICLLFWVAVLLIWGALFGGDTWTLS
jgi:hypothetical protein